MHFYSGKTDTEICLNFYKESLNLEWHLHSCLFHAKEFPVAPHCK